MAPSPSHPSTLLANIIKASTCLRERRNEKKKKQEEDKEWNTERSREKDEGKIRKQGKGRTGRKIRVEAGSKIGGKREK